MVPSRPTVQLRRDPALTDEQARAALRTCYGIILAAAERAEVAARQQSEEAQHIYRRLKVASQQHAHQKRREGEHGDAVALGLSSEAVGVPGRALVETDDVESERRDRLEVGRRIAVDVCNEWLGGHDRRGVTVGQSLSIDAPTVSGQYDSLSASSPWVVADWSREVDNGEESRSGDSSPFLS